MHLSPDTVTRTFNQSTVTTNTQAFNHNSDSEPILQPVSKFRQSFANQPTVETPPVSINQIPEAGSVKTEKRSLLPEPELHEEDYQTADEGACEPLTHTRHRRSPEYPNRDRMTLRSGRRF